MCHALDNALYSRSANYCHWNSLIRIRVLWSTYHSHPDKAYGGHHTAPGKSQRYEAMIESHGWRAVARSAKTGFFIYLIIHEDDYQINLDPLLRFHIRF